MKKDTRFTLYVSYFKILQSSNHGIGNKKEEMPAGILGQHEGIRLVGKS